MLKSLIIVYWISLIIKTTRICRAYYFIKHLQVYCPICKQPNKKTKTNLWFIYFPSAGDLRDMGLRHGLGRSPGEGHGNPLQYSCLENPMDRGAWQTTVHRVAQSWTRLKWLKHAIIFHRWGNEGSDRLGALFQASLLDHRVKRLPAMQETQIRSLDWKDPLEKEIATHSSIVAWKILWTEGPCSLLSIKLPRVRQAWACLQVRSLRQPR